MTKPLIVAACGLIILLFSGCVGSTSVILMPDENGKVGAVTVKTDGDFRVIDKAYNSVTTTALGSKIAQTQALTESNVSTEYANVLKAQPTKAVSFVLYFLVGSTELTDKSQASISTVIAKINERSPTEINVIGHTDTTGLDESNIQLSLKRAKAVEKILKESMTSHNPISIKWFGWHDPMIATPPNVNEPRNRRVEILIL
jgi:outer membrane protein OmpA-like peptidoglycan-associated protein